jgi:hypothetical protein
VPRAARNGPRESEESLTVPEIVALIKSLRRLC